jgi:galactose-1-phosphate uridylyltransferase
MTSFIIKSHVDRPLSFWSKDKSCPFCRIVERTAPSYTVYENDMVIAFLGWLQFEKPFPTLIHLGLFKI